MISKRVDLLKKLGIAIPLTTSQLQDEVLKIRNRVVHGGYDVTSQEARRLTAHVDSVMRVITPQFAVTP